MHPPSIHGSLRTLVKESLQVHTSELPNTSISFWIVADVLWHKVLDIDCSWHTFHGIITR